MKKNDADEQAGTYTLPTLFGKYFLQLLSEI